MLDAHELQADVARMTKLKALAESGAIDGPSSYFNHLIDIYGDVGRMTTNHTFTIQERQRVDAYLSSLTE